MKGIKQLKQKIQSTPPTIITKNGITLQNALLWNSVLLKIHKLSVHHIEPTSFTVSAKQILVNYFFNIWNACKTFSKILWNVKVRPHILPDPSATLPRWTYSWFLCTFQEYACICQHVWVCILCHLFFLCECYWNIVFIMVDFFILVYYTATTSLCQQRFI